MDSSDFNKGWNAALEHVSERVGLFLSPEEADTIRFYVCKSAERNGIRLGRTYLHQLA